MTKSIFDTVPQIALPSSRVFHSATKLRKFDTGKTQNPARWPEAWKKIFYKAYPRFEQHVLSEPSTGPNSFQNVLLERKSTRDFYKAPLEEDQISNILYYAAGRKSLIKKSAGTSRFYPSAGGRYPLEVYPVVLNVKQVPAGVYHYHVKTHSLEILLKPPFFRELFRQFNQSWLRSAAALILISAIFERTEGKYKDRGYRHILTECGHLSQNIYLMCAKERVGCCAVGGFIDDGLNKLLDINGIDESIVGALALGSSKP